MNVLCEVCLHPRPGRHKTKCTTGLTELFDTIDDRRERLELTPAKLGMGEGGAHEFESKPPINLTVRAHQDPNSSPWRLGVDDVDRPTLSVDGTLTYWWVTARKVGGDYRDVAWVVWQPWIGDMVNALRILARQLRAATGDPEPTPIGHCLKVIGIDEHELIYCREPLFMPESAPRGDDESIRDLPAITCPEPSCGRVYQGAELIRLKLAEETPHHRHSTLVSTVQGAPQNPAHPDGQPVWRWLTTDQYEAAREAERQAAR